MHLWFWVLNIVLLGESVLDLGRRIRRHLGNLGIRPSFWDLSKRPRVFNKTSILAGRNSKDSATPAGFFSWPCDGPESGSSFSSLRAFPLSQEQTRIPPKTQGGTSPLYPDAWSCKVQGRCWRPAFPAARCPILHTHTPCLWSSSYFSLFMVGGMPHARYFIRA